MITLYYKLISSPFLGGEALVLTRTESGNPDTVFIPSKPEYSHISSSYVREMIKYGECLDNALPTSVIEYIKKNTTR